MFHIALQRYVFKKKNLYYGKNIEMLFSTVQIVRSNFVEIFEILRTKDYYHSEDKILFILTHNEN